jgi:hypothetical protein
VPSSAGRALRALGSPDYRRRPFGLAALEAGRSALTAGAGAGWDARARSE